MPTVSTKGALNDGILRFLVIGAGSRGNAYAKGVAPLQNAMIAAIAEPIQSKRETFGKKYIWSNGSPRKDQTFESWQEFVLYEEKRRLDGAAGHPVVPGMDGAIICTLDHTHVEIVEALAPLGLHIMCEKPLATNLRDCHRIQLALERAALAGAKRVFSTGHVLRYSPHNMLLKTILDQGAIGEILSMEHTEPVGFWHFAHSYVRYAP